MGDDDTIASPSGTWLHQRLECDDIDVAVFGSCADPNALVPSSNGGMDSSTSAENIVVLCVYPFPLQQYNESSLNDGRE